MPKHDECTCSPNHQNKCQYNKSTPNEGVNMRPYFGSYPDDLEARTTAFIDSGLKISSSKK